MASNLWEYVWMKEWLATYESDPARVEAALSMLRGAFDMAYMSEARCDDATRASFRENIAKAEAGDPSGFAASTALNYE